MLVVDFLTTTASRPDGTRDNRHFLLATSNVPFVATAELLGVLARHLGGGSGGAAERLGAPQQQQQQPQQPQPQQQQAQQQQAQQTPVAVLQNTSRRLWREACAARSWPRARLADEFATALWRLRTAPVLRAPFPHLRV